MPSLRVIHRARLTHPRPCAGRLPQVSISSPANSHLQTQLPQGAQEVSPGRKSWESCTPHPASPVGAAEPRRRLSTKLLRHPPGPSFHAHRASLSTGAAPNPLRPHHFHLRGATGLAFETREITKRLIRRFNLDCSCQIWHIAISESASEATDLRW